MSRKLRHGRSALCELYILNTKTSYLVSRALCDALNNTFMPRACSDTLLVCFFFYIVIYVNIDTSDIRTNYMSPTLRHGLSVLCEALHSQHYCVL